MFRPQSISSTDARKYFTKLINKVSFSSKSFVIQTYRQPIVRIVNENYIRALEEVLGKKTVSQVMQIAGDERLLEAEKMEQIKKTFQRRLSGSLQPQPKPHPQQKPATQKHEAGNTETRKDVAATHASPKIASPKPQPPAENPKSQNPTSHLPPPTSNRNRGVLLAPTPPSVLNYRHDGNNDRQT